MMSQAPIVEKWRALQRESRLVRYGGAFVATWVALSLWTLFPVVHRHPFSVFLAAVVITARFLGLGPALLCSVLSIACLDFVVFPPQFQFSLDTRQDAERLAVFLALSVLVGSLTRKRTEAEIKADRTLREMATIVECSDDAIFSTDPEGNITSWNRGAERLYGYSAEEAVGTSVLRFAPPEKRDEVESNRQLLNRGETVPYHETERIRKDGSRVPVMLTVSPLRTAQGEIVGASAIARDLSARRHSEEAVRRSEKLATAGRIAASIAHEINNPLEAVLNLLYLARNDPRQAEQYLLMAEAEVGRIARLAQQTLGLVRDNPAMGHMDPAAIMDDILQLYARKLDGKQIRVVRRYRGQAEIHGYSGEVRQLLANLLVNAVDAMQPGGCLQVRVAGGRRWSDQQPGVRLTVADNGSGIPRESLLRLFEPFYTTKHGTGTGLGLWVSHGIVKKHGGSIRVRSRSEGPRCGSVFSVFLPATAVKSQVA